MSRAESAIFTVLFMITDKNGNKTILTYDSKGNVVKIRYPAVGGVIPEETFVYNSRNQLTGHTDHRGTVTLYTDRLSERIYHKIQVVNM